MNRISLLLHVTEGEAKPQPNMLKTLPIFLAALLKKFTHYSFFILISLPIIPILFFFILLFCILTSRETWA